VSRELLSDILPCVALLEKLFSCNSESITAGHVKDHSTAIICFVQKFNRLGYALTLVVTYSETDSV